MSDWQDMESAPRDGTHIQAEIPGHGSDNVIFWIDGLVDTEMESRQGERWRGRKLSPCS